METVVSLASLDWLLLCTERLKNGRPLWCVTAFLCPFVILSKETLLLSSHGASWVCATFRYARTKVRRHNRQVCVGRMTALLPLTETAIPNKQPFSLAVPNSFNVVIHAHVVRKDIRGCAKVPISCFAR
jgi:hypothetical protein